MSQNGELEQVRASFQLSRREYARGVRDYLRISHLVSWVQALVLILAVAASALMTVLMERMSFLNTLLVVLSAMVALYGGYLYWVKPGRTFDRRPELSQPVSFLFTREDITRIDPKAGVILDWKLQKLWRGAEFYYLFGEEDGYLLLPLRAFEGEEDRLHFEALARAACPGLSIRRVGRVKRTASASGERDREDR